MSAEHFTIPIPAAATTRAPGLDWLRAAAALAVVALHAGLPYMTHPLPALSWCVLSGPASSAVDLLCWAINGCVMPVFFLTGGYFAADLWKRAPGASFLVHRSRRLLVPLALAFVVVLAADMHVWLCGWVAEGAIRARKIRSIALDEPWRSQFWGVAHLWYLEALWTISVGAAAIAWLWQTSTWASIAARSGRLIRALHPRSHQGALVWAGLSGTLLAAEPEILIGFRQRWFPSLPMLLFYATFFAAGWTWPRTSPREGDRRQAWAGVVRSLMLFPIVLLIVHQHVRTRQTGFDLLPVTIVFSLFGWWGATSLFSLALSVRGGKTPGPVQFVAEASFWMYLVHHPLVGLTQVALLRSGLPAEWRFTAALTAGLWLSLSTYAVFVRKTWLGALLNGRGTTAPREELPPAIEVARPERLAA